ncbi:MAG: type IV secretion system DNA-binding domain-containing protein [Deltaproteobacteria bacterium]|nr:type IV secretion system DNA-binding domain-containing protein [Deltaproteobacteria bacterium]
MAEKVPTNPTPQFLNAPGDVYDLGDKPTIQRYPLLYSPKSTSQLNTARLPPLAAMRDMDLAYREQALSTETLARETLSLLLFLAIVAHLLAWGMVLLDQLIPITWAYALAMSVGGAATVTLVLTRRATALGIVWRLGGPLAFAALAHLLSFILPSRLLGSLILAGLTFGAFAVEGAAPCRFYQAWLTTHPRLRPETRATLQPAGGAPDYRLLAIVLAIAVGVPMLSASAAIVSLYVLAFSRLAPHRFGLRLVPVAREVLVQFLHYGAQSTHAPGIWQAPTTLRRRIATVCLLLLPLFVTLAEALCLYAPNDILWFGASGHYTAAALRELLHDSPVRWLEVFFYLLRDGSPLWVFILPVALIIALTLPLVLLLAVYARPLLEAAEQRDRIEGVRNADGTWTSGLDEDGRTEWQWYVDRLRISPHVAPDPLGGTVHEAHHLFLGVEPNFKFPVLLDRDVLHEHAYICGETGSGKTSLGVMPLVLQLLRGGEPRDGQHGPPRPPMVILDLKGDPAFFHTLREECATLKIPFRFFTPEKDRASHYFNPFTSLKTTSRSLPQLCQLILDSLALSHGEGYGRSYYSRQSRYALLSVLQKNPNIDSFDALYKELEALKREKKDVFELISTIHALTFYPQLLTTAATPPAADSVIDMARVLEERQVVYFWLPAALESISVREIGKLALYALLTAAIDRQRAGAEERKALLVIDEFQRLAGENFKIILEQARSFGVAAMLANQTQADLDTPSGDLRPTVRTNTRLKLYFSVSEPTEVRALMEMSGEEVALMSSFTSGYSPQGSTSSATWAEIVKPRLTRNDIIGATDHPLHAIAQISRGSGYSQFGGLPIPVRTTWPLTRDTYDARATAAWPTPTPHLSVGTKAVDTIERERVEEAAAVAAAQKAKLQKLLASKAEKS